MPAHVHVFGDGEAKIDLAEGDPVLIWSYSMSPGDVRRVMRAVREHQAFLLRKWKDIHG